MKQYYSIAGSVICVSGKAGKIMDMFQGFECEESEELLFTLEVEEEEALWDSYGIRYMHCPSGFEHVLMQEGGCGNSRLLANRDWSRMYINEGKTGNTGWMELLAAAFYSRLSMFGGIYMHASAVEYRGEAVVFTAASGTGKTTQAELWAKHLGAKVLNGDKVFLRTDKVQVEAWGSPWKGSSPYGENIGAPVKGIVVLKQGQENRIERLDRGQVMELFMPHVFFPSWDMRCMERVMESLNIVAEQIPMYCLTCRPDEEAVQIVRGRIWMDDGNGYPKKLRRKYDEEEICGSGDECDAVEFEGEYCNKSGL